MGFHRKPTLAEGSLCPRGPLWSQRQVHTPKGCGGELTLGPAQNQVLKLPCKCQLKLACVIMVEAILLTGVLLRNIGTPAFASCRLEPWTLPFVSWGELSVHSSSGQCVGGTVPSPDA